MKRVFVGGSRKITRFNEVIRDRLDGMISSGLDVLVGDANGSDKATQRHFAEVGYRDLTIYFSGDAPRNNLGDWPCLRISSNSKKKDFSFYVAKDLAMADAADHALMLWDGESKGTLNNILNLLERRKKVVVYFSPEKRCHTLTQPNELQLILERCCVGALEIFEKKINLSSRLRGGQQCLNLGQ